MGLFENLGRKVGRVTHEAKRAAAEEARFSCEDCGERFYADSETCPECGSENVVEREETQSDTDRTDETDATARTVDGGAKQDGATEDEVEPDETTTDERE